MRWNLTRFLLTLSFLAITSLHAQNQTMPTKRAGRNIFRVGGYFNEGGAKSGQYRVKASIPSFQKNRHLCWIEMTS
jgi:hypothetical protein